MIRLPSLMTLVALTASATAAPFTVYVGTYTGPGASEGIYRTTTDTETGVLGEPVLAAKQENPSFLALTPDKKTFLAVQETSKGALLSYGIKADGALELRNRQAVGNAPCHLEVSPNGQFVAVANYTSGDVLVCPLKSSGELGAVSDRRQHVGSSVNAERQEGPHAHGVHFFAGTSRFLAVDLGTDRVENYQIDNEGRMQGAISDGFGLPKGSGPRHCVVTPEVVWVVNELTSTVCEVRRAADGGWSVGAPISTLPEGWKGQNTCAEILLHPGGKYVVATNRGHNSVARFERLPEGGLRFLGTTPSGGGSPRGAAFSPDGKQLLVANQDTGNLVPFAFDASSGDLQPKGKPVSISKANCVLFIP